VQLRRYLRDEDLGQQPERHCREGLGRLGLLLGRLSSGLFRRGFGRGSVDGRSVSSRSVSSRSVSSRSIRSRSILSRSILSRRGLRRSLLRRRGLSGRTRAVLRSVGRAVGLRSVGDYLCGCVSIRREVEGRGVVVIVVIGHLWLAPRADTSCSANSHAAPAGAANSFGVRPAHGSDHEGHTAPKSASMPAATGSSDASQAIIAPSAPVRGIVGALSRFLRRAHARYIAIAERIQT